MLEPIALAWASWIGLGVGLVGTAISLIGLVLTFREARRAKVAAERAGSEVAKALDAIRSRTRLASFASAVAQADLIVFRIEKDALRSGQDTFTSFRRVIREALETIPLLTTSSAGFGRQELDARLEKMARLISSNADQKTKKAQMMDAFHDVRTYLIDQEAKARQESFT